MLDASRINFSFRQQPLALGTSHRTACSCSDSEATSAPEDQKFSGELDRWKTAKTSFINREGEWETPGHITRDGGWEPEVHINRDGEWSSDRDWGHNRD